MSQAKQFRSRRCSGPGETHSAWETRHLFMGTSTDYGDFYRAVREANMRRRGKHQMRVLCGDPYIDWNKVKTKEDIGPFLGHRDQCTRRW